MEGYLGALMLSALPVLGNAGGGVLAELVRVSRRTLGLALHAAAGIVFGVIGVELMPRALEVASPWTTILAFLAGGLFYLAVDWGVERLKERRAEGGGVGWMIFFSVSMDLFSDGIMIGVGATVSTGLGLLLALGQVPADVPEGFATIATSKDRGVPRRARLLLTAALALCNPPGEDARSSASLTRHSVKLLASPGGIEAAAPMDSIAQGSPT